MLSEVRAPRVQIAYDVEVSGQNKSVELPFVMGVMADLSGHDAAALPPVKDRSFVEIDAANFDRRMQEVTPGLRIHVPNRLAQDQGDMMAVDLQFQQMDDFRPDRLARQIPALANLLDAREKLATLLLYMDGKFNAADLIKQLLDNQQLLSQVADLESTQAGVHDTKSQGE